MKLADALGIVAWKDRRQLLSTDHINESVTLVWPSLLMCAAVNLMDFWGIDQDPRWQLLLSIGRSLGYDAQTLLPLTSETQLTEAEISITFGLEVAQAIRLPCLTQMLHQPELKKQAWQQLCTHLIPKTPS